MEIVKARIKGTQDVRFMRTLMKGDEVMYQESDFLYSPDEVEVLEVKSIQPASEPQHEAGLEQLPLEMIRKFSEVADGYVELFDRQYWQRQRVEFVKIFLQRKGLNENATVQSIVDCADEFVKYLKETGL